MKFNNSKLIKAIISICVVITIIFTVIPKVVKAVPLITLGGCYLMGQLFGEKYSTDNIVEYRQFDNHIECEKSGRYGSLCFFPETLPESANNKCYYYYASNKDLFDNSYQIYLEYTLSDEDYKKEFDRISIFGKYDDNNFKYPAYVIKNNENCTYEYVLVNKKENKLMYVFTQFIRKDKIKFNKEYLPKNYD